jgi:hypothetical protein
MEFFLNDKKIKLKNNIVGERIEESLKKGKEQEMYPFV